MSQNIENEKARIIETAIRTSRGLIAGTLLAMTHDARANGLAEDEILAMRDVVLSEVMAQVFAADRAALIGAAKCITPYEGLVIKASKMIAQRFSDRVDEITREYIAHVENIMKETKQ